MDRPCFLTSGEPARLIPVAGDSSKESRAVSILFATLMSVPAFARVVMGSIGQRMGSRATIHGFTEVVLATGGDAARLRPDGLLVLDGGRGRVWQCLVEAKIGRADIETDQICKYLALAKANGIQSVITISNQFVALPSHAPVKVPKSTLRGVELYHWSWTFLLTQAMLLLNEHQFATAEQRYILAEMVRYFTHSSTGVSTFDRMNVEWRELVARVQAGASLTRSSPIVESSVAAWHQEARDLCLLMARKLSRPVRLRLSRAHSDDAWQRLRDDSEHLVRHNELCCTLEIPDAAAPLVIVAHLQRRSVTVSMSLTAPRDKRRASSRINWLLRQLVKAETNGLHIRATWPGRAPATQALLSALRADATSLEAENRNLAPTQFEVMLIKDLAGKFSGTRTFIEMLEEAVPSFYEQAGQHLRAYVAPPPRIRKEQADAAAEEPLEEMADEAEVAASEAADDLAAASATADSPAR